MPPAIQRRMQVSAVGLGCWTGSAAGSGRGSPVARVVSAAALMLWRKSRRLKFGEGTLAVIVLPSIIVPGGIVLDQPIHAVRYTAREAGCPRPFGRPGASYCG